MKITSKSLLPKFKTFSLDYFKKPFCYKEIKKNINYMKCLNLNLHFLTIKNIKKI